jgi:hypothetical protein
MSWTSTDLSNIEESIAQGVLTVNIRGNVTTYRSLDEMVRIRDMIRAELGTVTNGGITYQTPKHSKGFC